MSYGIASSLGLSIESLHHDIKGGHQNIKGVKFVQNCTNRGARS